MGRRNDLCEFDESQIEMSGRLGQSISKTAAIMGCFQSAVAGSQVPAETQTLSTLHGRCDKADIRQTLRKDLAVRGIGKMYLGVWRSALTAIRNVLGIGTEKKFWRFLMMTPLFQGKFKICFIFLLLVTFIGLVTVNFLNTEFKPSKLLFYGIGEKLSFIYLPSNPQKFSNETMTTEPQVSNTTNVLVSMASVLNDNKKEKTNVPTNQDLTSTMAQPDHEAYPRNYQFILDEPDICKQRKPFLVLMVPVAPQQLEARDAIRITWGNESVVQGKNVIVLFMLGLNGEEDEAKQIERLIPESRQHHDLIQSNFLDTYKNLTTKTMVILDWLATHCPQASYAMKIDSDMFLNVENLMSLLLMENTPKENYITGMVMWNRPVVRNKFSKWYVPEEVYPENVYPTYLLGMGYVFSNDLPEKLVKVSKHIRPFYIEDAYVGACLKKLGFAPSNPPDPSKFKAYFNGAYDRNEFARVITTILGSPQQLINFWQDLKRPT
ncbi:UDP-Gal:betaGlcNAc beta 1,3-galactosyltransferase polypeptide 1-like [Silurus asotus]|uniref:Hexosyltransferase n=1 Tax=Silurus asotus TaxID=30991 RepID=A0AAD5B8N0_SILAS|nr:UDP-Gal:betaGlcNAc beta 1,3-galactosyltransferase polypeptide 1-like [Silurus asotus]